MAAISSVPFCITGISFMHPNTKSCRTKFARLRPCNNANANVSAGATRDTFGVVRDARKRNWMVCAENANGNGSEESAFSLKSFLEEAKSLGRVRIIVNTGVGVLESITSLEKLFYHTIEGRGEYANVMSKEDNVDFHLLVGRVKGAKLVKGKIMWEGIASYTIRFVDDKGSSAASFLLMWKADTDGQYDPGQVEAFENLLRKRLPKQQIWRAEKYYCCCH